MLKIGHKIFAKEFTLNRFLWATIPLQDFDGTFATTIGGRLNLSLSCYSLQTIVCVCPRHFQCHSNKNNENSKNDNDKSSSSSSSRTEMLKFE